MISSPEAYSPRGQIPAYALSIRIFGWENDKETRQSSLAYPQPTTTATSFQVSPNFPPFFIFFRVIPPGLKVIPLKKCLFGCKFLVKNKFLVVNFWLIQKFLAKHTKIFGRTFRAYKNFAKTTIMLIKKSFKKKGTWGSGLNETKPTVWALSVGLFAPCQ